MVEGVVDPLLVVILGPTGSGKTTLSVALGRHFDGEIVSCDSVAVYQGLEIGSAKPSAEQRGLVPHHLLDVVAPDAFSLHNGSFYSNSKTTGDWETFIAVELVKYIDDHYRTIPNRMSRGLTGHSMGGHGALTLGLLT